eukprot:1162024-Alexandrium_andersonii.AAC.1
MADPKTALGRGQAQKAIQAASLAEEEDHEEEEEAEEELGWFPLGWAFGTPKPLLAIGNEDNQPAGEQDKEEEDQQVQLLALMDEGMGEDAKGEEEPPTKKAK